ncbi:TPA: exotoxin beta-grasp domain-containing protein [Staphylococcus aureus]
MKLKNIAKASLALGILTTGMITTTAQPVKASEYSDLRAVSNDTFNLKTYYTGPNFNYKNLKGYKEGNKVEFVDEITHQLNVIDLKGSDKEKLKDMIDGTLFDVFVVREGTTKDATNYSIGGISKPNSKSYIVTLKNVNLKVSKKVSSNSATVASSHFEINKEEISLKELDFKLRKQLIDNHDLYKTEPKDSKITVTMNNGDYYTFELNKKLQEHRMGDVIDGTKIKEIYVELN